MTSGGGGAKRRRGVGKGVATLLVLLLNLLVAVPTVDVVAVAEGGGLVTNTLSKKGEVVEKEGAGRKEEGGEANPFPSSSSTFCSASNIRLDCGE